MMEVSGICIGPWVGQLVVRGREVRLGPLEHRLLIFLMRNANTLLSKEVIAAETWAGRNEEGKLIGAILSQCTSGGFDRQLRRTPRYQD